MGALSDALEDGRRATLVAQRDELAAAIENLRLLDPAKISALSRELREVMREIEAIDALAPAAKGSPLDELKERRAARGAATADQERPAGGR